MATRTRRINTIQDSVELIPQDNEPIVVGDDITIEVVSTDELITPAIIQNYPIDLIHIEDLSPKIELSEPMLEVISPVLLTINESQESVITNEVQVIKLTTDVIVPKLVSNASCFNLCANLTDITTVLIITKDNIRINKSVTILDNNRQFRGIVLEGHERALIPTNLKFNIPENYMMRIYAKPNLSFNLGLTLCSGVDIIESSYKDALYISLYNSSNIRCTIKSGDKIAQAEIVPCSMTNFKLIV